MKETDEQKLQIVHNMLQHAMQHPLELEVLSKFTEILLLNPDDYSWYKAAYVTQADELCILDALADPRWDFRTIKGLCNETGFESSRIEKILNKYPQFVRRSRVPNKDGQALYTLNSKKESMREKLALLQIFISKSLG